eukprot:3413208-Amphidinium_carterae.1
MQHVDQENARLRSEGLGGIASTCASVAVADQKERERETLREKPPILGGQQAGLRDRQARKEDNW